MLNVRQKQEKVGKSGVVLQSEFKANDSKMLSARERQTTQFRRHKLWWRTLTVDFIFDFMEYILIQRYSQDILATVCVLLFWKLTLLINALRNIFIKYLGVYFTRSLNTKLNILFSAAFFPIAHTILKFSGFQFLPLHSNRWTSLNKMKWPNRKEK